MNELSRQTINNLTQVATPFAIPFLIALIKKFWPMIPNAWLPVLCPIFGAVIDIAASGTIGAGTAWGAALGAAGVGVRETFDQLSGNAKKPSRLEPPAPPAT